MIELPFNCRWGAPGNKGWRLDQWVHEIVHFPLLVNWLLVARHFRWLLLPHCWRLVRPLALGFIAATALNTAFVGRLSLVTEKRDWGSIVDGDWRRWGGGWWGWRCCGRGTRDRAVSRHNLSGRAGYDHRLFPDCGVDQHENGTQKNDSQHGWGEEWDYYQAKRREMIGLTEVTGLEAFYNPSLSMDLRH